MLAILVGVFGFIGAYLSGHAGIPKTSNVLVAARDIQPGQAIDGDSITVVTVPGKVPPTLVTKDDLKNIMGKTVNYEIPAGVPISENYVSDQAQRDGLDQDQVGVWLPVSLENGGDVMPGDRVDLFAATNNAMTAGGRPVLSYVRVVRAVNSSGTDLNRAREVNTIGATPVSSPGVPAAVELAVTAPQAAQLASIMQSSHVLLALSPWPP
jgi:Flp pilus assembly protein CpaB